MISSEFLVKKCREHYPYFLLDAYFAWKVDCKQSKKSLQELPKDHLARRLMDLHIVDFSDTFDNKFFIKNLEDFLLIRAREEQCSESIIDLIEYEKADDESLLERVDKALYVGLTSNIKPQIKEVFETLEDTLTQYERVTVYTDEVIDIALEKQLDIAIVITFRDLSISMYTFSDSMMTLENFLESINDSFRVIPNYHKFVLKFGRC